MEPSRIDRCIGPKKKKANTIGKSFTRRRMQKAKDGLDEKGALNDLSAPPT